MKDENRWGYYEFMHNSPLYENIINEYGHIRYEMDNAKWRIHCLTSQSERTLSDPNYLGYRNGPVPGVYGDKNGRWHRYAGNHNKNLISEHSDNLKCKFESKYLLSEYGITPKVRADRASIVNFMIVDWDYPYFNGIHRSWKTSRKKKQWMKL